MPASSAKTNSGATLQFASKGWHSLTLLFDFDPSLQPGSPSQSAKALESASLNLHEALLTN